MALTRIGTVAASFGRDVDQALDKVAGLITEARRGDVDLLVLPSSTIGGYLPDLGFGWAAGASRCAAVPDVPPAFALDAWPLRRVAELARDMVVCLGFCEADGPMRYNTAVCLSGDGVLGRHRKVHQPLGEYAAYASGDGFDAFDTPVGRLGMLIDYDKTFPESARSLALDGASVIAALSAWPISTTNAAQVMADDRQARLFDVYDAARAAENQVVWVSSNQTGAFGDLRFLGQAKVVGPGGETLARSWSEEALVQVEVDIDQEVRHARRVLHHLVERRPGSYDTDRRPHGDRYRLDATAV